MDKIGLGFHHLTPTMGRDYKNNTEIILDFLAEKDFYWQNHFDMQPRLVNCQQFEVGATVVLCFNYWPASRGYSKKAVFKVPDDPKAEALRLIAKKSKADFNKAIRAAGGRPTKKGK